MNIIVDIVEIYLVLEDLIDDLTAIGLPLNGIDAVPILHYPTGSNEIKPELVADHPLPICQMHITRRPIHPLEVYCSDLRSVQFYGPPVMSKSQLFSVCACMHVPSAFECRLRKIHARGLSLV
jgi:hypothetical protein